MRKRSSATISHDSSSGSARLRDALDRALVHALFRALVVGPLLTLGACNDSKRDPTNEVDLAALVVSGGALVPAFDERITSYSMVVGALTDSILVTATTESPRAALEIDGLPAVSGQPFGPLALATGANGIVVEVTGFDGLTVQTYTITVERSPLTAGRAAPSRSVAPAAPVLAPAGTRHGGSAPRMRASSTESSASARGNVLVVFTRTGAGWRRVACLELSSWEGARGTFDLGALLGSARAFEGDVLVVAVASAGCAGLVCAHDGSNGCALSSRVSCCLLRRAGIWQAVGDARAVQRSRRTRRRSITRPRSRSTSRSCSSTTRGSFAGCE